MTKVSSDCFWSFGIICQWAGTADSGCSVLKESLVWIPSEEKSVRIMSSDHHWKFSKFFHFTLFFTLINKRFWACINLTTRWRCNLIFRYPSATSSQSEHLHRMSSRFPSTCSSFNFPSRLPGCWWRHL